MKTHDDARKLLAIWSFREPTAAEAQGLGAYIDQQEAAERKLAKAIVEQCQATSDAIERAEAAEQEVNDLREKLKAATERTEAAEQASAELRLELDGDDLTLHDKIALGEDALTQALELAQRNEKRAEAAEREVARLRRQLEAVPLDADNELLHAVAVARAEGRAEGYERGKASVRGKTLERPPLILPDEEEDADP